MPKISSDTALMALQNKDKLYHPVITICMLLAPQNQKTEAIFKIASVFFLSQNAEMLQQNLDADQDQNGASHKLGAVFVLCAKNIADKHTAEG